MLINQPLKHDKVHLLLTDQLAVICLNQVLFLTILPENQIELDIGLDPDDELRALLYEILVWIATSVPVVDAIVSPEHISTSYIDIAVKIAIEVSRKANQAHLKTVLVFLQLVIQKLDSHRVLLLELVPTFDQSIEKARLAHLSQIFWPFFNFGQRSQVMHVDFLKV